MATNRIQLAVQYRKNKNERSRGYNHYYAEVYRAQPLTTRGLAEHIQSHDTSLGLDVINGVLTLLSGCIPELVAQGQPVKIDGLGTFSPYIANKKLGATEEQMLNKSFTPASIIEGVRIRFLPDSTKLDKLTGAAFKEKCTLELRNIVDTKQVTLNGKPQKVQTIKPVLTAVAEWKEQNAGTSGGGGDDDEGPATGQEQG